MAYGGGYSMPGEYVHIIGQGKKFGEYILFKGIVISAGQVGPPNAFMEKDIARPKFFIFCAVKAQPAGGMARSINNFEGYVA